MVMKLYYGGFGDYMEFVVADSEEQAVLKVGVKINAPFLPITVEEISVVDGYVIQTVVAVYGHTERITDSVSGISADAFIADSNGKPIEAEEVEIKSENSPRHCKKCEFTCENQGELLAHYRAEHPKGD